MYREKITGLWCRENTLDEYVVKEQSCYSKFLSLVRDSTVMDIGGNIGAFAYKAIESGAKKVISFEPEPGNIELFKMQDFYESPKVKLIERAISDKNGVADFYVNSSGKNKGLHSLQEIQGRHKIQVKTVEFKQALTKFSPEYIKIDIEGGEYDIDLSNLPLNVKGIAIEIHLTHGDNREQGENLIKILKKQFPVVLKEPKITDKNWTTLFIGRRK